MRFKIKIIFSLILVLLLSACAETSVTDDLLGKIDKNKNVKYIIISEKEKNDALYILSGEIGDEKSEKETQTENRIKQKEENNPIKKEEDELEEPESKIIPPDNSDTDPNNNYDNNQDVNHDNNGNNSNEIIEIEPAETQENESLDGVTIPEYNNDENTAENSDHQIGDEPGAAVLPEDNTDIEDGE